MTTEREQFFNEWQEMGEQIKRLSSIVQNPVENLDYQSYLEACELRAKALDKFNNLWHDTNHFIQISCHSKWVENGEEK